MYCDNNNLTFIYNLPESLKYLYCKNNKINKLDIYGLINLEVLDCSDNNIRILNLCELKNLKYLYCSNNSILELDILGLDNLIYLDCKENKYLFKISNIPDSIKHLDCSSCNISYSK